MWKFARPIKHKIEKTRWPTADEAARSLLFSPTQIGRLEARSRTWVPAMVPWRATEDGLVTPQNLDWYRLFAEGRPGVLVVEALAQVGAVLALREIEDRDQKLVLFTGIKEARFRRPVVPGDTLVLEVTALRIGSRVQRMRGEAKVDGQIASDAEIMSVIAPLPTRPISCWRTYSAICASSMG